jgi:hypothetical protein
MNRLQYMTGLVVYVIAKMLDVVLWFWTPSLRKPLFSHVCIKVLYLSYNPDLPLFFKSLLRMHGITRKSYALRHLPPVWMDVMGSSRYLMTQL